MLFCNLEFNEKKYLELCISVPEIVKYYNINIHVHANDNSKRRMHHTITWWNHLRDENNYLSNFRPFFFLEIHFIVFLYSTVLYINIICQTFTTQGIWNRYFPLCFMKKIHIFTTKGKIQKTKENDTKFLKKKIKNAFTIVYSTSFIHRGIGLERLANKIN